MTTNLRDGYLRKNGVPYSQNAVVTEYFDRVPGPDNAQWLIVKTTVEDPTYLAQPYLSSAHFMREPDASKWRPSAVRGRSAARAHQVRRPMTVSCY